MITKINATLKEIKQIAEGTKEITLIPEEDFIFILGQYLRIEVPQLQTEGKKSLPFSIASPPYSISSPLNEKEIKIAFREGISDFKKFIQNENNVGEKIIIQGPFGRMALPSEEEEKSEIVFIAGGIGITPFMDLIPYSLKNHQHKITLLYSNKLKERAAYLEELKFLEEKHEKFKIIDTYKRIDADFINSKIENLQNKIFYICGTIEMVDTIKSILESLEIPKEKIHFEKFSGY